MWTRRQWLGSTAAAPAAAFSQTVSRSPVDFRYAPLRGQTAICFPDDPHKSLVGSRGELLYDHVRNRGMDHFPVAIEFSAGGSEPDEILDQGLESLRTPIVRTTIGRPAARIGLTAFATRRDGEGRVDNVLFEAASRKAERVPVLPVVVVRTHRKLRLERTGGVTLLWQTEGGPESLLLVTALPLGLRDNGNHYALTVPVEGAAAANAGPVLFRFPREGQSPAQIPVGTGEGVALLESARQFWREWQPFGVGVDWQAPAPYGDFLLACARNIQQAREVKNGRITFQVGPTVYRGIWVVDGHFLLEAGRYLGYAREALQGLDATWALQDHDGGIFAGAGREHWKDTGIAMFSLVRQAELSGDPEIFHARREAVARAAGYLEQLCRRAVEMGGSCGRYGLLPPGMGDGGLRGSRHEFTNTLWTLAGLKAVTEAQQRWRLSGFETVEPLYRRLDRNARAAAVQEMQRHPAGFTYLPMLMKEDAAWSDADPWLRPKPQVAQWALSHCLYPGLLFGPDDPIVRGHVALMQWCTKEDVPAETGWLPHEGLWTYNAAFVAHAYLWAGELDWALRAFHGFLNHATPLYCWREEQALRGSLVTGYVGDMPHNWASAECVLFLRHMLALEDGPALRLLEGMRGAPLAARQPWMLRSTPSRFGALDLTLEPETGGWRLRFAREGRAAPTQVLLPARLGRFALRRVEGAAFRPQAARVAVAPEASAWSAVWSG